MLEQPIYLRFTRILNLFGLKEAYLKEIWKADPTAPHIYQLPGKRGVQVVKREELEEWIEHSREWEELR